MCNPLLIVHAKNKVCGPATICYNATAYQKWKEIIVICSYLQLSCRTDGETDWGQCLMSPSIRQPQNNVYHRSDGSALLIASNGFMRSSMLLITPWSNQANQANS